MTTKMSLVPGLRYIERGFTGKVDVLAKGCLYKLCKKINTFSRNLYYTPWFNSEDMKRDFLFNGRVH